MPITVTHAKVSAIADDPTAAAAGEVLPSDWNANHEVVLDDTQINIQNGQTVTGITRTAAGSGYTSAPSVTIAAPTGTGGTQATASCSIGVITATVSAGGTGYTVGDVLTVSGGTFTTAATVTVATLSGSAVATVTVSNVGAYTAAPANPAAVTGGTGSGATFTLGFGVNSAFTVTAAGSGYVEQPAVTFSGGGGSAAAAYAVVGTFTTFKSLGSGTVSSVTNSGFVFRTPNTAAPAFVIREAVGADSFVMVNPQALYTNVVALGATNANLGLYANGGGNVVIGTSGTSNVTQFRVSHTASAVNYVQATGAATGGGPTISAQGSDTNVGLVLQSKGTLPLYLVTPGAIDVRIQPNNLRSLSVNSVASAVNYWSMTNAAATFAPSIAVAGSDANIDLQLSPKGTGRVRFGTHTATADTAISGYIEILDAGGTVRRLAVIT